MIETISIPFRTRAGTLALGVGAAIAGVVLLQAPSVWQALVLAGLLVALASLLASDAKLYWLAVFVATIPLNITKLLFLTPEDVAAMKRHFGLGVVENLVPQLYLSDLPLLVLLVLWASEILARRRRILLPKAMLMPIAFVLWSLLTLAAAPAPVLGLVWAFYQLKNLLVFLWFVNARLDRTALRMIVVLLLASLAVQSAVTAYSFYAQTGEHLWGDLFGVSHTSREIREGPARGSGAAYVYEKGDLLRGTGTVGVGNLQAMYFVTLLPLALAIGLFASRGVGRALCLMAFAGGVAALLLTFSRGGLIASLIALATLGTLAARRGLLARRTFVLLATSALLFAVALAPLLYEYITSRPTFLEMRFRHGTAGLQIMTQHPVLGVGMNNFNLAIPQSAYGGVFSSAPIHNHYLRVAIETGLFGLLLYLAFFAWVGVQAYRCVWLQDALLASTALAIVASLAGIAAYWMNDLFYDPIIRLQLWTLVALVIVIRQVGEAPSASEPAAGPIPDPADSGLVPAKPGAPA